MLLLYTSPARQGGTSLDLSFAGGALPSGTSFLRASAGAYFDASGVLQTAASDAPRFDYDPVTHAARGILIEPQAQNWFAYSIPRLTDNGGSGYWNSQTTNATVTNNAAVAPNGVTEASLLKDNATSSSHYIGYANSYLPSSFIEGSVYAYSLYAKAGTAHVVQPWFALSGVYTYATFDLAAGTVGSTNNLTDVSIAPVGNDWFRCSMSFMFPVGGSILRLYLALTNDDANASYRPSYVGASKGVYVWGAQLEPSAKATSAIAANGSFVTRAADQLSFGVPPGVSTLRDTFDNATTQDVSVSPGAYTVPTNLDRPRILRIQGV